MNLKKSVILIMLAIFVQTGIAFAGGTQNIAVVDIQKVVSSSPKVKALVKMHEAKNKEYVDLIKKAQADINKQTDEKTKKATAQKYEKQIAAKKEANIKEYSAKLTETENSVKSQIAAKAQEMGYTMVIPKAAVVWGGEDITDEVLKVIK